MTVMNDSPEDQPLDAIIEEPAVAPAPGEDYPYASRLPSLATRLPVGTLSEDFLSSYFPFFRFQSPQPAQYMVPRRFGMSAILGIMTALALLFGSFRLLNAPPGVYLFFGLQSLAICFAQMMSGKSPRLASSIAGAILVPVFVFPLLVGELGRWGLGVFAAALLSLFVFGIPIGAFLGYLTGTCAAGIFLVMDYLEPFLQWQGNSSRSTNA